MAPHTHCTLREETGLPHWLVVDEAQDLHFCWPPGGGFDAVEGLCLVSY